jgi:glucose/arabinose dehydrogenase
VSKIAWQIPSGEPIEGLILWHAGPYCSTVFSGVPCNDSAATISGMKTHRLFVLILCCLWLQPGQAEISLNLVKLPAGFSIAIYAEGVENARQMARGDNGTIFAGSRRAGKLWAILDDDGDQRADQVRLIDSDLKLPAGLEFRDGSLYVGVVEEVLRYDDIELKLDDPPEPVIVSDAFPSKKHHGWKYLRFGPDDKLYVPIGIPCNICDKEGFGLIRRMNPDGSDLETFAWGVRNSVGLAFHPENGQLWFTDNGRDHLGDDLPADELNHAPRKGMHFGIPYCHQGDLLDEEFGKGKSCKDYTPPAAKLDPHGAALGLVFYTGDMFPLEYKNRLFITQHGSWNRSEKVGYRILALDVLPDGTVLDQEVFASGWLQGQKAWGRPNDVMVMPDGALLVSDDAADVIYRISYQK